MSIRPLIRFADPIALALAAALLLAAPAAPAQTGTAAAKAGKAPGTKPAAPRTAPPRAAGAERQQRELQSEQRQLQSRLAQLKRQLATAEASHSEATDALRESEAAISSANRRLRELAQSRRLVERQIAALQERSRTAGARQSGEERQLAQVLRVQVALAQQSAAQSPSAWPWQQLLADDPQRAARDLAYLDYVARAKLNAIGELRERREELAALETESRAKQAELAAIAGDEQTSRAQLLREQQARRRTLDRLARQIGAQRQSIATLERDEQRLGSLIGELNKLLAEQARRERQRAAQAARPAAEPRRPGPPAAAEADAGRAAEPPADGRFAQLRGKLLLPVKGEVGARFGAARRTEAGVNAPTWKGVFIRAAAGSDVHAVAAGRVIFADWLRGFGNLLILDHGEGFLSVYGSNESLLAAVGERVDAGEVIAAVGNSGGSSESGLYFELRFQGRPFDPLRWAQAR